jgi:hypothetical protein
VLLEEYGIKIGPGGAPSAHARNSVYRHWLNAVSRQNGAGHLAWMLASRDDATGDLYPDYDHFTFYSADDVPSIRDHALQMISEDDAERFSG